VVAGYRNDPEAARFQDWELPVPVERVAAQIHEYLAAEWPLLGGGLNIAVEHQGDLIGDLYVGWNDDGSEAVVGYTLMRPHQGKGFATEAAAALVDHLFANGVAVVRASLDPENLASARVLEKVGFRLVETSTVMIRGEWVDDAVYELTRADQAA